MKNNLFTQFQQMRLKRPQGQVAILFILLLAVVFIFMAVTYNVGMISLGQTGLNNAADAAALLGASYVGSYAYVIYQYNNFQMDRCESNFNFLNAFKIVIAIVLTVVSFGAASPLLPALGAFSAGVGVVQQSLVGSTQQELFNMSYTDQIKTKVLQTAIFGLSSDPNTVTDINDLDQDNSTTDQIPAIQDWDNRRVAFLKSNFIDSLTTWNCLVNQEPTSECPDIGPLGALINRIDGGHVYNDATTPMGTGDGSLNLAEANFDYRSYLNNEFIPLLEDILIRFYYLGFIRPADMPDNFFINNIDPTAPPNIPAHINAIRDAIHSVIVEDTSNLCQDNSYYSYHCGTWGSGHQNKTYTYTGLYTEGLCRVANFDPTDPVNSTEPCDRVKSLIREMDGFLDSIEGIKLLEGKAKSYTPEYVLDYILHPYNSNSNPEDEVTWQDSQHVHHTQTKSSGYTILKGWQEQIKIWRGLLQSVSVPQQALIQGCYNMCNTEICNVLLSTTSCDLVNPACKKLQGLLKFETDVSYDRAYTEVVGGAYEPLIEECCMGPDRTKCGRPLSELHAGTDWDCADNNGRVKWGCYSTCYNQEYWHRHPAFTVTAAETRSCADFCLPASQPLICYWATPGCQSTFNPAYGGVNCNFVCQRACRSAFNTEHGGLGPYNTTKLFDAQIQRALNILGDPNNQAAGGLYWEIESLLPQMEQAYNTLSSQIAQMRDRAIYAWKDTEGWHLIMAEVGSFSTPSSYMTSDSSWLGMVQTVCQHVTLGSNPNIDVWAWRYDQGRTVKFAGSGKLPWWTMRTGRKDAQDKEPAFMGDTTKKNWKDLNLLDPDVAEQSVGCFLCNYGLRAHTKAHFDVEEIYNNITDTKWTTPHFCRTCP